MAHSQITDDALNALRAKIGKPISRTTLPFYTEINIDAARRFGFAIGDDNPLWHDPDYARKSTWGAPLAPPCILYSTDNVVSGAVEGLPGVHAMFSGTNWTWHTPIPIGAHIHTECVLKDLTVRTTRFAGRAVQQTYKVSFFDQNQTLLAEADSWCFRTERDTARERGDKYEEELYQPYRYSDADIERFSNHYLSEAPRGTKPRFWEDVEVGDAVGPILKGPYTVTAAVAFMQAWGSYAIQNHRQAWKYYARHPKLANPNENNVPEPPVRVHWSQEFAREVGVPGAYDFGPERISWLSHLMTDWIGDSGFLKHLNIEIRGHNLVGDATWCKGKVSRKDRVGDEGLVECQLVAENQHGTVTSLGTAIARLPLKNG